MGHVACRRMGRAFLAPSHTATSLLHSTGALYMELACSTCNQPVKAATLSCMPASTGRPAIDCSQPSSVRVVTGLAHMQPGASAGQTVFREGTVRLRLLELENIKPHRKLLDCTAHVQLVLDTDVPPRQFCQTPSIDVRNGAAKFQPAHAATFTEQPSATANEASETKLSVDFTVRRVPRTGVVHMALFRHTRLGPRIVAVGALHMDGVKHHQEGGEDEKHVVVWQARHTGEGIGTLKLKAFWLSTDQEIKELKLAEMKARTGCVFCCVFALCETPPAQAGGSLLLSDCASEK